MDNLQEDLKELMKYNAVSIKKYIEKSLSNGDIKELKNRIASLRELIEKEDVKTLEEGYSKNEN
jgi:hypothetical protein